MGINKRSEISSLLEDAKSLQTELEIAISTTPTSQTRNNLCDAHIHLLASIEYLEHTETSGSPS